MGTLKTDIIVGAGGNNEVTFVNNKFTGTASGNVTVPGEGGTVTTNLQQGLGKNWVFFDGSTSTPAAADSFNHSSITDSSTGNYQNNFTNAMSNANFSGLGFANDQNYGDGAHNTSYLQFENKNDAGTSAADTNRVSMAVLGDLA